MAIRVDEGERGKNYTFSARAGGRPGCSRKKRRVGAKWQLPTQSQSQAQPPSRLGSAIGAVTPYIRTRSRAVAKGVATNRRDGLGDGDGDLAEVRLVFRYRRLGNGRAYSSPNPPEITVVVWGKVGVSAAGTAPPLGFRGGQGKGSR
jgi:hypothetical protein